MNLDTIIEAKRRHLDQRQKRIPTAAVIALAEMQMRPRPILNVMTDGSRVTLIGQIRLSQTYDPVTTALMLVREGVDAIALYTDQQVYSKGLDDLLFVARGVPETPVICQDYVFDSYHVAEIRAARASGLIAHNTVLAPASLRQVVTNSQRWMMTTFAQVSTEAELAHTANLSPHVIAIGQDADFEAQRDLPLFQSLSSQIPFNTKTMPLGRLSSLEDVAAVIEAGADAVIVDTTLIAGKLSRKALDDLLQQPSRW